MKHEPKLVAVGDNCLDVSLSKDTVTVGGNALNVAVQWQRNGWNGRYFGAVAGDPEGEVVLDALTPTGLARADVEIRPGDTAVTLLKDEAGERKILLESLGVGIDYIPDDQRYQAMRDADWVHLGTNADERLVRRLVSDGIAFSVDVSTAHFALSLAGVPLVFASGPDDPDIPVEPLIEALHRSGAAQVLVTCGRRGAFFHDGQAIFFAPALDIEPVDTCGAGDSFIAAFLTAYLFEKMEAEAALRHAAAKAADTCMHPGGFPQPVQPIPGWLREKYVEIIRQVEDV
ncbi:PfkB family carbohydrate kinase [Brucella sp. IR073]|uniref:PfkB family carbohydrate kinase n=1 Tax=unclassified Brucella TaxID=2632610 RepID=UPI003B9841C4